MNYIRHMNRVQEVFMKDSRLNPTHISLYHALFYFWNLNRFSQSFYIARDEVMRIAKIGGLATYHKCISNLNDWSYLKYEPSKNRFRGSEIIMFNFETSGEQVLNKLKTSLKQAQEHEVNSIKQEENRTKKPKSLRATVNYFLSKNCTTTEAEKFHFYYSKQHWKTKTGNDIIDWKKLAQAWIEKVKDYQQGKIPLSRKAKQEDYLRTPNRKNKNYGQPL